MQVEELMRSKFIPKVLSNLGYEELIKEIDDKINSFGDPNQLLHAIINILNNAKDALKIASNVSEKLVFIFSINENENNIIITIKDNAGGIEEDIVDKIFEPYFTTKHQTQGTGLGLYMTHQIIEKMGGSISVQNENFEFEGSVCYGAKFIISLPLS